MDNKNYLTTKQVAEMTGFAASTLNNLRYHGRGPRYLKVGNKRVLYDPADVDAWIRANVKETCDSLRIARG